MTSSWSGVRSSSSLAHSQPSSPRTAPQKVFQLGSSMSVDITLSVADDLMQFLVDSDDVRAVCTPPRHRRASSKSRLVVDDELTRRERTPSPSLSVPGSDVLSPPSFSDCSPTTSPRDRERPREVRTRRAARSRQRSESSSASSLSTGQLLLSVPRRRNDDDATPAVTSSQAAASAAPAGARPASPARARPASPVGGRQTSASVEHDVTVGDANSQRSRDLFSLKSPRDDAENLGKSLSGAQRIAHLDASSDAVQLTSLVEMLPPQQQASESDERRATSNVDSRQTVTTADDTHTSSQKLSSQRPKAMSVDSDKLLKEFEAIKKLKLFRGLTRHGRSSPQATDRHGKSSSQTTDRRGAGSRLRANVDVKQSAAVRPRTSTDHRSVTASTTDQRSSSDSGAARRPSVAVRTPSARHGNTARQQDKPTTRRKLDVSGLTKSRRPASWTWTSHVTLQRLSSCQQQRRAGLQPGSRTVARTDRATMSYGCTPRRRSFVDSFPHFLFLCRALD